MSNDEHYYVPESSHWPVVGAVGLLLTVVGVSNWLNGSDPAYWVFVAGLLVIVFMLIGWFGDVIKESESGIYNEQVGVSFRMGMFWFIFSEVMFFAVFFGALFYTRSMSIPWLGGDATSVSLARPKSRTFACSSSVTKMLSGFRSR